MFLAILKDDAEIPLNDVPGKIQHVLEEFEDVMPTKLPKRLPLRERWTTSLNWIMVQSHPPPCLIEWPLPSWRN